MKRDDYNLQKDIRLEIIKKSPLAFYRENYNCPLKTEFLVKDAEKSSSMKVFHMLINTHDYDEVWEFIKKAECLPDADDKTTIFIDNFDPSYMFCLLYNIIKFDDIKMYIELKYNVTKYKNTRGWA